ncbi:tetratricopeptide repeat protein [Streptomyces sp. NPDC000229]|uniref:tetratricopeptide repeat protein n=1 Tax=Streptomyces sp. NPDC000229 TaxID=3154247 RepID=UPI003334351C
MVSGDHVTQVDRATLLPAEALAPATCPDGLVNLPGRTDLFVGRTRELALLDEAFRDSQGVVVQAVHGLGGIGKSTLAAQWAATRTCDHNPVWWITAESPGDVDAGLAALATGMQPALAAVLSQDALRERALQWLSANDEWLLILDNVTDPADIKPLLSRATRGRFLITSRLASGWHGLARSVSLGVLAPAEAVELFTRILRHQGPRDLDGAPELCAELGFLPLAVEQAAAYCVQACITPRQFSTLLAEYPARMLDTVVEGGEQGGGVIARIWELAMARLGEDPLPPMILLILGWFAADGVPRSLLDEVLSDPAPAVVEALGRLAAHSMIRMREDGTLSVHRLVQAVARTPDEQSGERLAEFIDGARELATMALVTVALRTTPRDPADWDLWRTLLPHIEALAEHADPQTDTAHTVRLFTHVSHFLIAQGNARRAVHLLERAEAAAVRLWGHDDRVTLGVRSDRAVALDEAGNTANVTSLYAEVLQALARVADSDDIDVLNALNNLACAERAAGNPTAAIRLYEEALPRLACLVGEDDPHFFIMRNNLSFAHWEAGDRARAVTLMEELSARCVHVLGEEHPASLTTLHNLGYFATEQLDAGRAIPVMERVIEGRARVLGPDHPDTLNSQGTLAMAYLADCTPERSLTLLDETLAACLRALGADHPRTSHIRSNREFVQRVVSAVGPRDPAHIPRRPGGEGQAQAERP